MFVKIPFSSWPGAIAASAPVWQLASTVTHETLDWPWLVARPISFSLFQFSSGFLQAWNVSSFNHTAAGLLLSSKIPKISFEWVIEIVYTCMMCLWSQEAVKEHSKEIQRGFHSKSRASTGAIFCQGCQPGGVRLGWGDGSMLWESAGSLAPDWRWSEFTIGLEPLGTGPEFFFFELLICLRCMFCTDLF